MSWYDDWKLKDWISLALSLAGTAGLYITFHDRPSSRLGYRAETIRVVEAGELKSAVSVVKSDGTTITNNLYALEVTIWNAGNTQLGRPADVVREPVTLVLPGAVEILDARIQKTNMNAAALQIVRPSQSAVRFEWSTFDPQNAFRALVLYQADAARNPEVRMQIVGASIDGYSSNYAAMTDYRDHGRPLPSNWIFFFGAIFVATIGGALGVSAWPPEVAFRVRVTAVAGLVGIIAIIFLLLGQFVVRDQPPQF